MTTAQQKQKYITQIPTRLNGIYQLYNTTRQALSIAKMARILIITLLLWNVMITGFLIYDKVTEHIQQHQEQINRQIAIEELIPLESITE